MSETKIFLSQGNVLNTHFYFLSPLCFYQVMIITSSLSFNTSLSPTAFLKQYAVHLWSLSHPWFGVSKGTSKTRRGSEKEQRCLFYTYLERKQASWKCYGFFIRASQSIWSNLQFLNIIPSYHIPVTFSSLYFCVCYIY